MWNLACKAKDLDKITRQQWIPEIVARTTCDEHQVKRIRFEKSFRRIFFDFIANSFSLLSAVVGKFLWPKSTFWSFGALKFSLEKKKTFLVFDRLLDIVASFLIFEIARLFICAKFNFTFQWAPTKFHRQIIPKMQNIFGFRLRWFTRTSWFGLGKRLNRKIEHNWIIVYPISRRHRRYRGRRQQFQLEQLAKQRIHANRHRESSLRSKLVVSV